MASTDRGSSKPQKSLGRLLGERFSSNFSSNQLLSPFVSAKVGGVAEYVVQALSATDLIDAAKLAASQKIEYRVIARGTGTLVSDVGFPGLVIIDRTQGVAFNPETSLVLAASGIEVNKLISACATQGLGGIEFLSAVPGTIGGAVVTNAGYAGNNISTAVKDVTVLIIEGQESKVITVDAAELQFLPYKSLFLKTSSFPPIILTVRLQLARLQQDEIIRRLSFYRKRNYFINTATSLLGGCFSPPLEDLVAPEAKLLQRIRIPRFRIQVNNGTIQATNARVTAGNFRDAIKQVTTKATELGVNLEERLTYLGYWPDGEEIAER